MADGTLTVSRTAPNDIKIRDLYVILDDREVATLDYGQSIDLNVSEGQHTLSATNRLFTQKQTVTVAPGEAIRFEAANVASGCGGLLFIVVGMGPYSVRLRRI